MVRVLHIVGKMDCGGQENFIMNLYRNIDKEKVQFDFVVHSKDEGFFDSEIEKLGGKIYRITPMTENLLKHIKELKKVLIENNYNIVHRHTDSSIIFVDLLISKRCGVKYRIAHSHNTVSSKLKILSILFRPLLNKYANFKFACGEAAGKWLFGNCSNNVYVIKNGIQVKDFLFSEKIRNKMRTELEIQDKFVVGNIARFNKQKNHLFLLDIFNCVAKKKKNAILLLVGDGEEKDIIFKRANELGIINKIIFLGIRKDVCDILQAIDVFVFPSLYEGLPVSLIEAQASGVKMFISDTITKEVNVTNSIEYLNINDYAEKWADAICSSNYTRNSIISGIKENGYDAIDSAKRLEKMYLDMK